MKDCHLLDLTLLTVNRKTNSRYMLICWNNLLEAITSNWSLKDANFTSSDHTSYDFLQSHMS